MGGLPCLVGSNPTLSAALVIGGAIVEGDKDKDPKLLADHIWDLHAKRDRFRLEIATD